MRVKIRSSNYKNLIFFASISLIFSLYIFQQYDSTKFIGDPMDGRLILLLHEHWYKFFTRKENFFETNFFYPEINTFGYSDTYLISGLIYVLFRLHNFNSILSIELTYLTIFSLSVVTILLFAKTFFKHFFTRYFFVLYCFSSQIYLIKVSTEINTLFYYLLLAIPLFYSLYFNSTNKKIKNFSIFMVLILPLIFALTVWYMLFFLLFFILIFFVLLLITRKFNLIWKIIQKDIIYLINQKSFLSIIIASNILLAVLFLRLYLPNTNNLIKVESDILNSTPNVSNLFFNPNSLYFEDGFFGFIFLFIFISSFILIIQSKSKKRFFLIINLYFTSVLILLSIIKFFNVSIFYILWKFVPIFETIRYPSRFLILINLIIIIVILFFFENDLKIKPNYKIIKTYLTILLSFQLIYNLNNIQIFKYIKKDFNSTIYENQLKDLNSCKTFILDGESRSVWIDNLEAMTIASLTDKKTLNGYSGTIPLGYPLGDWNKDSNFFDLTIWASKKDNLNNLCLINQRGVQPVELPVDVYLTNDFDVIERNSKTYWSWSLNSNSELKIFNFSDSNESINVEFKARIPECAQKNESALNFYDSNNNNIYVDKLTTKLSDYSLNIEVKALSETYVKVNVDSLPCFIDGDKRKVAFMIYDLKVY